MGRRLTMRCRRALLAFTPPARRLSHLKDAGVRLAVGSDTMPGAGVLAEIDFLKDTDVFSNLELLKMWRRRRQR
jgi:hypothetical protein